MATTTTTTNLTLFGLGAMGTAMATQFLKQGHTPTVWNRTAAKATPLVEQGAHLAATIPAAIATSPLLIFCLLDNAAVERTLGAGPPSLAGKTILNLTNGTPNQARRLSTLASARGARYIHGGIMATPDMIGAPHAVILYSGASADAYASVEGVLAVLGTGKYLGDDAGSASLHDLALLSGMYGLFAGFLHATALVRSEGEGVSATEFLALLAPWLQAMTGYLGLLARQIDDGVYTAQTSNLAMQLVALENACAASREQGVSAEVMLPLKGLVERAVREGRGGHDISSLIDYFRRASV
ncbi:oxidoreductase [Aspergillus terreus]|uniref:Oxidoreductase n=1 Tax=Aspergillus terreus TaxID=33178 RepID=A0A5M3Z900_ASPTE|nr:hypothetical protein ATETN484_0012001400 [Aspergillus terreus]GFF19241.1 oxidoreductase [Aspergillus terreus]